MATLKTSVTELPESRVRVDAEVPAEEVERKLQQAARKLGGQLRIPGFRKGKVPPPVVMRRLGREAVFDEALRSSLSEWYIDAIDTAGIAPIGEPDINFSEDVPGQGEPLAFTIEIGVRPTAKLGEYKGLEVGRREPTVADADVDAELDRLRDRVATLDTVERPAQQGDFVVLDYLGKVDGEPFPGGEGRDQLIELGSGRLIEGFEEQLAGASAGDEVTVNVTFPQDYVPELSGKDATFDVTVSEVKSKRLPELDDDFAAEASEFDTVGELREDIASRLRDQDEHAVEREFEQAVLEAAANEAVVDLPDKLVHARAHEMLEQTFSALGRQGIGKDTYLKIAGKDEEELAHEAEPDAAAALRREAVLAAVVEAEDIEPSDEELLEALTPSAERDGADPAELMERLRKAGRLEELRQDVATTQAAELLVREATPISVEQAKARQKLWTPGKDEAEAAPAGSSGSSSKLWTPGS
ncbi:MAG TPA: trigger factor [Solirubrobacteraceae bacterium]|jgi:trigger factor